MNPIRSRHTWLLIAGCTLSSAACEPPPREAYSGVSVDVYVAVISELADLGRFPPGGPVETRDAVADSVRQRILERHGVTAELLIDFAREAGRSPEVMETIMERVSAVTDSLAARRATGDAPPRELPDGVGPAPGTGDGDGVTAELGDDDGPGDGLARFRRARLLRERMAAGDSALDTVAASPLPRVPGE